MLSPIARVSGATPCQFFSTLGAGWNPRSSTVAHSFEASAADARLLRMAVSLETQAMENCGGARGNCVNKMAEAVAFACPRTSRTVTFGEKTEVSAGRVC